MDKNKYLNLIKKIDEYEKQNNEKILGKINSNSRIGKKFNSIDEYYSWVNDNIKKLGLDDSNNELNEDIGIVSKYLSNVDGIQFLVFIQQKNSPLDYEISSDYEMIIKDKKIQYQVNVGIDDKYLLTYSNKNELIDASNDYDYLCMLIQNDCNKLLELLTEHI